MRRNILNPRLILIQNGIFRRCTLEEDNQICYYCTDPLQIKKKGKSFFNFKALLQEIRSWVLPKESVVFRRQTDHPLLTGFDRMK